MKKAELKFETALMEIEQEQGADEADPVIDHPACHSLLNFFIPILSTVLMVPVVLYITGDGQFSKGSGSMSVYSGVMFGTVVSFIWFRARGILNVENFFKELYIGYASMVKISSIMILAFLMGHISAELNTGQYIASITSGVILRILDRLYLSDCCGHVAGDGHLMGNLRHYDPDRRSAGGLIRHRSALYDWRRDFRLNFWRYDVPDLQRCYRRLDGDQLRPY